MRLLRHQGQIAGALGGIERKGLQRLDEACQHGERRPYFMRHVRHEIASHRLGLFERCDVPREQHPTIARVGMHLHRQPQRMASALARQCRAVDHDVTAVVPRSQISHEGRVSHEIDQMLLQVTLGIDAELFGCSLVRPFDAPLLVDQHHAIR